MTRSRRRMAGLTAALAVHLLALAALVPTIRDLRKAEAAEPPAPAMQIQLVHLQSRLGRTAPQPADTPEPQPAKAPEAFGAQLAQADPTPDPVDAAPAGDDQAIYRVPFRDAETQAFAALRHGLDCDHVDLSALPEATLGLCATAAKVRTSLSF